MIEKEKQRRAFEQYYAMGAARSLTKLAARLGVATSTVKEWSRALNWQGRIEERDGEVAQAVAERTTAAEIDAQTRYRQLVDLGIVSLARQVAEGKIRGTLADLDRLIRLQHFLEGKADSRQELVARELQGKSIVELREMVRVEVAELQELEAEVEEGTEAGPEGRESEPQDEEAEPDRTGADE